MSWRYPSGLEGPWSHHSYLCAVCETCVARGKSWQQQWTENQCGWRDRQDRWIPVPWERSSSLPSAPSSPVSLWRQGVELRPWGIGSFCRLGALLPSGPSQSRRSALESSRSSAILLPTFRCSNSSKTWFCFVRRLTAAVRIYTCFSRVVGRGSSSWTLLMVAIDRVSTMQLFCRGSDSCGLPHYSRFP